MEDTPATAAPETSAAPASPPTSAPAAPVSTSAPPTSTPSAAQPPQRASAQLRDVPPPSFQHGEPEPPPVAPAAPAAPLTPAAAPVSAEPSSAPQIPQFVSQLHELGFADVRDEQEAQARLVEAFRLERERQHYLQQQYEQALPYARQYAQLQQDPRWQAFQQQQQAPAAPQPPQSWWTAPQVDLSLLERYREQVLDETGKPTGWKWKEEAPEEYRQQVAEYTHAVQEWERSILTKPHEILPQIIETEAQRVFERLWQDRTQQMQAQTFVQQVVENNADWLYVRDPVSQQPLVDMTGQPVLSPEGRQVEQYAAAAAQLGIADPRARWQYAMREYELQLRRRAAQQHTSTQQAQASSTEQKLQHLQQAATAATQRGGSIPAPHDPGRRAQQRGMSAGEKLQQAFRAQGRDVVSPIQP